jgi:hypothetical protein
LGKQIKLSVKDLLPFLVYDNPSLHCDYRPYMLVSDVHNSEVADFVNREIIAMTNFSKSQRKRDSKLEKFVK